MFMRDAQLLVLVFLVAAFIHGLARAIYFNLPRKKGVHYKKKEKSAKEGWASWWQRKEAPATSLHARLAAAETGGSILSYANTSLDSFTLSNLVFAVYRCGKLRVPPSAGFARLLARIEPARLSARGAAHVLWGIARVKPLGEDQLARKVAAVACAKMTDLRPADAVCAVWAALELWPEEADVLACLRTLAGYSAGEMVGLLATLAAHPSAHAHPATQRAIEALAEAQVADLAEREKLVRALNALEAVAPAARSRILVAVAESLATTDERSVLRAVAVAALLRVEEVGPGPIEAVARVAMDSGFAGFSAQHAVDLGGAVARAALEGMEEFFLDLAKATTSLELTLEQKQELRAAYTDVGLGTLLE